MVAGKAFKSKCTGMESGVACANRACLCMHTSGWLLLVHAALPEQMRSMDTQNGAEAEVHGVL